MILRFLVGWLALIALGGCGEDTSSTLPEAPSAEEVPSGSESPQWSRLECQESARCLNPVLNVDYEVLVSFLKVNFSDSLHDETNHPRAVFECGRRVLRLWVQRFRLHSGDDVDSNQIGKFAYQVIDPRTCLLRPGYLHRTNRYFEQTKEYKSETESN